MRKTILTLLVLMLFAIMAIGQNQGHVIIWPKDSAVRVQWKHVPNTIDGDVTYSVPDSGSYYAQYGGTPVRLIAFETHPQRNNGTIHLRNGSLSVDDDAAGDNPNLIQYGESVRFCVRKYHPYTTPDYFMGKFWFKLNQKSNVKVQIWDDYKKVGNPRNIVNYKAKKGQNKLNLLLCGKCVGLTPQSPKDAFSVSQVQLWFDESCLPVVRIYNTQGELVFEGVESEFTGKGLHVIVYPSGETKKVHFESNEPYFTPFNMN